MLAYRNPMGDTWTATYDEFKQRLSLSAPGGGTTRYQYDDHGLLASETDPLGRIWSTGWTPLGLPWRETSGWALSTPSLERSCV